MMSVSSFPERLPIGIENSGNTCYCNAVIQILLTARKFCLWFLEADARRLCSNPRSRFKGQLCVAWVKLLRKAYASGKTDGRSYKPLNCSSLLALLRAVHPQFALNRQNDAHEFLRNFLDGLSSDCNRVLKPRAREDLDDRPGEDIQDSSERFWRASLGDEQSIVTDLFAGQQATRLTCKTCKNVRHRFDPFLDLSVEFDEKESSNCGTLERMIKNSYVNDIVYRQLDCPFCKQRCEAEVRQLLWRLPSHYLVIHIKRFRWNSRLGSLSRINNFLELPEQGTLDMRQYCPFSTHPSTEHGAFVLEGIVCQSGTVDSGHYTAAAVVGNQWWHFSDESSHGMRQLPDGRSIYLLLFRRAQSYPPPTRDSSFTPWPRLLDPYRRIRAQSVARQESANLRTQRAWASMASKEGSARARAGGTPRRSSPALRDFREASFSSSEDRSDSSDSGSLTRGVQTPRRRHAGCSPGASCRYRGRSVLASEQKEYKTHTNVTYYQSDNARYSRDTRQEKCFENGGGVPRSSAVLRYHTPGVHTPQFREEAWDVSVGMSRLCLKGREDVSSHALKAKETESPAPHRSNSSSSSSSSSCRPAATPETEVYASTCFTRNYRLPSSPERSSVNLSQEARRSNGGFAECTDTSSSMRRSRMPSPLSLREIPAPVPIQPMPVRRLIPYERSLEGTGAMSQESWAERRQHKGKRDKGQTRRPTHAGERTPASRHFI